jgi:GMP synthase (glutamine-hydrolysing)
MKKFLIVKMGETLTHLAQRRGDFEDWIIASLKIDPNSIRVVRAYDGNLLPNPAQLSGVVITGSHAMVTDSEKWSQLTASWIPLVIHAQIPMLGICYGHQIMALALGGTVGMNPAGSEFGTTEINLTSLASDDALFQGLNRKQKVHVSHSQSILKLPHGAKHLASGNGDPNQAFSIGKCAWGVQFHPEFDVDIVKTYIRHYSEVLHKEGINTREILKTVEPTPIGPELLRRFGKMIT